MSAGRGRDRTRSRVDRVRVDDAVALPAWLRCAVHCPCLGLRLGDRAAGDIANEPLGEARRSLSL